MNFLIPHLNYLNRTQVQESFVLYENRVGERKWKKQWSQNSSRVKTDQPLNSHLVYIKFVPILSITRLRSSALSKGAINL